MRGTRGDPVAYGSPEFEAASRVARELSLERTQYNASSLRLVTRLLGSPAKTTRAIRTVRRLPSMELHTTDSPAGRVIRAQLDKRTLGVRAGRYARATLTLPEERAAYLRGRSRQAVRTNLTRAREAGIECRRLVDEEEIKTRSEQMLAARGWDPREPVPGITGGEIFLASDAEGETLAIAVIFADEECAWLAYMLASGPSELCGYARYALSVHVVHELIDRRVRVLMVDSTLYLTPGLQYFQRRLGFEARNVRLRPRPAEAPASARRFVPLEKRAPAEDAAAAQQVP